MVIPIGERGLTEQLLRQMETFFGLDATERQQVAAFASSALVKTQKCLSENVQFGSYWNEQGELVFSPNNSGQYLVFLYFLSRTAFENDNGVLADKAFYLNKMMNGCEIHYRVRMPDIFCASHSVGAVMGLAKYGNYFVFQQNSTVGGNHGVFPVFGRFVRLFANATVLGASNIGNNVFISAGALVKDEDIPDNTIVFGSSPNLVLKQKPPCYFYELSFFREHQSLKGRGYKQADS